MSDGGVVIDGVTVYGPMGCGLPSIDGTGPGPFSVPLPPEFAPTPPVTPSPKQPLQPHPMYPASYPPVALGAPTETGPRMVPVDYDESYYILRSNSVNGSPITPSGDMLKNEFATNGSWGVVDWAQRANWTAGVDWAGISNKPAHIGTYWYVGSGAPPYPFPGAFPGDLYLDSITGNVYQLS